MFAILCEILFRAQWLTQIAKYFVTSLKTSTSKGSQKLEIFSWKVPRENFT